MMTRKRIGCGIVTCNRPAGLMKLLRSIEGVQFDALVVVNDGKQIEEHQSVQLINNQQNIGVGKSKNKALRFLLEKECDHIFLIEDDIFIKSQSVFDKYIEVSEITGIQHLNFSQHGLLNKTKSGSPKPVIRADYAGVELELFKHCVGAFSYYTRRCLREVGLMDAAYYNAFEHVDHTFKIIKAGMHPGFWHFADIADSHIYIGDEGWAVEQSKISSQTEHKVWVENALEIFEAKHGVALRDITLDSQSRILQQLNEIYHKYSVKNVNEEVGILMS